MTTRQFQLVAVNGQQVVSVPGGAVGSSIIYLAFTTPPAAGAVSIEWRQIGAAAWTPLTQASNLPVVSGEVSAQVRGAVAQLRVTFTGLAGGAAPILWLSTSDVPVAAFGGNAAITVQGYPELNSKVGTQFDITTYIAVLAPGVWSYTLVTTGALPIAIKGRSVQFDGTGLELVTYKNPTLIGNPGVPAVPFNLNDRNPEPSLATLRGGIVAADVSALGTLWRPIQNVLGSSGQGNSRLVSGGDENGGAEVILAENTQYLFGVRNTGSSACRFSGYSTWYEGELDAPL